MMDSVWEVHIGDKVFKVNDPIVDTNGLIKGRVDDREIVIKNYDYYFKNDY